MYNLKIYYGETKNWKGFMMQNEFIYGVDTETGEYLASSGWTSEDKRAVYIYRFSGDDWKGDWERFEDIANNVRFDNQTEELLYKIIDEAKVEYEDVKNRSAEDIVADPYCYWILDTLQFSGYMDAISEVDESYYRDEIEEEEYDRRVEFIEDLYKSRLDTNRTYLYDITDFVVRVWQERWNDRLFRA